MSQKWLLFFSNHQILNFLLSFPAQTEKVSIAIPILIIGIILIFFKGINKLNPSRFKKLGMISSYLLSPIRGFISYSPILLKDLIDDFYYAEEKSLFLKKINFT